MNRKNIIIPDRSADYKSAVRELRVQLSSLQNLIKEHKLPVIIVFEGWEASGKGSMIAEVIKYLDPRFFKVHTVVKATAEEMKYPFLKRFWEMIPEYGKISILDRSWYQELSCAYCEGRISENEYCSRTEEIKTFEKQLTDDGYLIIKIFLDISRDEQKKRMKKLRGNASTKWRITDRDRYQNKNYGIYSEKFDRMLSETDFHFARWNIIDAEDKAFSKYTVFRTIINMISDRLENSISKIHHEKPFIDFIRLSDYSLEGKKADPEEYQKLLKKYQKELSKLHSRIYKAGVPVILCFEGWDAAGKGGAIKRISSALDPRGYEAVPVSAPDRTELNHHYLWRFWNHIPKAGHITIFDRTWYGRVMVEKIEGFTSQERCDEAYREINEFEHTLCSSGTVIIKFWLQIDQDEQLRRFTERQNTPEKQWKITDEDWRNREKWNQYEEAVDEMLSRTSTPYAGWNVIEANDKLYARLKILNIINDTLAFHLRKAEKTN